MTTSETTAEFTIDEPMVRKLLGVVDAGLVNGVGQPIPGKMCVEAAVCYAMGLPHGDKPTCVSRAVRRFKIGLNDARWCSDAARARGLRKLAVAQLGSRGVVDDVAFVKSLSEKIIRRLLPVVLRQVGLEMEAKRCEDEGTAAAAARYAAADVADVADSRLTLAADLALEVLVDLKSPGCEWLHLCEEQPQ